MKSLLSLHSKLSLWNHGLVCCAAIFASEEMARPLSLRMVSFREAPVFLKGATALRYPFGPGPRRLSGRPVQLSNEGLSQHRGITALGGKSPPLQDRQLDQKEMACTRYWQRAVAGIRQERRRRAGANRPRRTNPIRPTSGCTWAIGRSMSQAAHGLRVGTSGSLRPLD